MSKIILAGTSAVLQSTIKMEDMVTLGKLNPEALKKRDKDKNPIFMVSISDYSSGSINACNIAFDRFADANGYCTVSVDVGNCVDKKSAAVDYFGKAKEQLDSLEDTIKRAAIQAKQSRNRMMEDVVVTSAELAVNLQPAE